MSVQYDTYLQNHLANVKFGFDWLRSNLPNLVLPRLTGVDIAWQVEFAHDQSKTTPEEYKAYDDYFYGGNRSFAVVQAFQMAWLHHIHNNPHHWQHWVLINDEPSEGKIVIPMPHEHVIEMICDWWSFSWATGNLKEIFTWYEDHRIYIKLHPDTRTKVETILEQMKEKLEVDDDTV